MIDRKQAAQLLRSMWATPAELAQQLYAMAMSRQDRVVEAPVTIQVPPGRTAFRVVTAQTEPPSATPSSQASAVRRANLARSPQEGGPRPPTPQPDAPSSMGDWSLLARAAPGPTSPPTDGGSVDTGSFPGYRSEGPPAAPPQAQGAAVSYRRSDAVPVGLGGMALPADGGSVDSGPAPNVPVKPSQALAEGLAYLAKPQAAEAPKPAELAQVVPRQPPRFQPARPFVPQAEFTGPVAFSGAEPARFEVAPTIYVPRKREYAALQDWVRETFESIPFAQYYYNPLLCFVTGGSGKKWKGDLYPYGPTNTVEPKIAGATVTVKGVNDNWVAPVNSWIAPVIEIPNPDGADNNDFFYVVAPWQPGLACTTGTVTAGGSGTCPNISIGSGPVTWLTWPGSGNTASNGSGTVYNMGGSVSSGKVIQYKWIEGRPFVDVVLC